MARIEGMSRSRTLVARLAFFLSRRSYGRVITPARVYALDSRLLLAVGLMEEVQEWAKQTRAPVKQAEGARTPDDEAILTAKLDRFADFHAFRATFQVLAFFVLLWALVMV
jgi:hypothetical protein